MVEDVESDRLLFRCAIEFCLLLEQKLAPSISHQIKILALIMNASSEILPSAHKYLRKPFYFKTNCTSNSAISWAVEIY